MRYLSTNGLDLLIPDKDDPERDAVAGAFAASGGTVHRLGRFWDPPQFAPSTVRVYGPDTFCLVLQQKIGLSLVSPDDELLLRVPPQFLRRRAEKGILADGKDLTFPLFSKPITPKQFRGRVYASHSELAEECNGLPSTTPIFVCEPVDFRSEVRAFVLEGVVLDAAVYERGADLQEARSFIHGLTASLQLPPALVIDVGFIAERGWAVIEFNAAWGAGLNGCDAGKVLPAIIRASAG